MPGYNKKNLQKIVKQSLLEDVGRGDITTETLFKNDSGARAILLAKEDLVFAGKQVFEETFRQAGGSVKLKWKKREGDRVRKNSIICELKGSLKALLRGERLALNFVQRLSGIATMTDLFIRKLGNRRIKILDTRKTTPMLRALEKHAVKIGGGTNHRMGLYDRVFVKDNHIKAKGSITETLNILKARGRLKGAIIEASTLKEVKEALKNKAGWILLDNMGTAKIRSAIKTINGRAKIEISGSIRLKNINRLKGLRIDFISVGALTHSPKAVDISLKFQ